MMPPASQVAASIRQMVREGRYRVGDRLENERDLAERFGISRGTLRQAMELLERDRLVVRQQGRGTFIANPAYAQATDSDTALVGAIVYDKEGYFGPLLQSASSSSSERGYILATGSNLSDADEQRHVEAFLKGGIRGVLLAPRPEPECPAIARLRQAGVPVVLIDSYPLGCDEDFVSVDNRLGATMLVEHLVSLGHRRLLYFGHDNPCDLPCQPERVGGYREACAAAGIEPVIRYDASGRGPGSDDRLRAILTASDRPTAVVAFNDQWAVRVIAAARDVGLRVPEDLSVVGFDDTTLAQNYDVPLTTINPACEEVGVSAVDLLIDKIERPRKRPSIKTLVRPELVVRASTSRAPGVTARLHG